MRISISTPLWTNNLEVFAIGASFGCGVGGFGLAAPVLSFINADIGPDLNLSWVALSYLLTNSVGLMLVGRLSDLFGMCGIKDGLGLRCSYLQVDGGSSSAEML